jgi:hypothetical protein
MKKWIFCILKVTEDFGTDPDAVPLVKGTDPMIRIRIRIRTKIYHESGTLLRTAFNRNSLSKNIKEAIFFKYFKPVVQVKCQNIQIFAFQR